MDLEFKFGLTKPTVYAVTTETEAVSEMFRILVDEQRSETH